MTIKKELPINKPEIVNATKNYTIKTPLGAINVACSGFPAALKLANHIAWSRGIGLNTIDIIPKGRAKA